MSLRNNPQMLQDIRVIFKGNENMFKIQKGYGETITKTLLIPSELAETLEKLAYDNDLSVNQLVVQCLEYAIKDPETAAEDETV